jgi:hypothetical protein
LIWINCGGAALAIVIVSGFEQSDFERRAKLGSVWEKAARGDEIEQ